MNTDFSFLFSREPTEHSVVERNEALEKLEELDPTKAGVVKLRYFAGLTVPQAAKSLGISTSTADNYWAYARAWLRVEMMGGADD